MQFPVNLPVAGINATVADHFEMLFRDMADEARYELHDRKGLFNICAIFVAVVMEGDKVAIIFVNPGGGNDGTPQIAPDVFYGSFGVAFIWSGIDIETVFVFPVTAGFHLFEGRTDSGFHFVQQGSAESIAKVCIVKMADIPPETVIAVTAFRNKAVNVGIPFQVSAKGVKNHDKTGSEIHGFVLFEKHAGNNAVNSMKKAVKEGAVIQEKIPELFVNGENTVAVRGIDEFKGHGGSALHGIKVAAGRTEAAVAAERDKFQLSAVGTAVHGTARGRVTTVDHFINIFHLRISGVKSILYFFVMVCKNILKYVHETIMQENDTKRNP